MAPQPKVLFVLTSHDKLGNTGKPTGWYLVSSSPQIRRTNVIQSSMLTPPWPEMAHPYEVLAPHCEIITASPAGGEAPLDPSSVEAFKNDDISTNFLKTKEAVWKKTQKLSDILGHASEYAAVFFVGGHGPMFDLATDPTSHKLINEFHAADAIISAVCHGPAALAYVKLAPASASASAPAGYLLEGQRVTGFSNTEEDQVQLSSYMPFLLEDKLNEASGGRYEKAAEPWGEKVVVAKNGKLITGQNPASATGVGKAIYEAIFGEGAKKAEI